ncbi:MAG: (E)-4-hydroxy-3-methylbut-2-enyl-diphosphate synthase [Bacteroidales bacterium]|nr:(E)-4-hydroxy-3-methylbut-2-enyl-diphosphate synthase [Bacteroidales bacterium]
MYCESLTNYKRAKTIQVNIGNVPVGSENPIRIQTMTNTTTANVDQTLTQIIKCFENGADYVRVTTPTLSDVEALGNIIRKIRTILSDKPIIADVHFNSKVANQAAKTAHKVRINPGNLVDSKKFKKIEYSKKEYKAELEKIKIVCEPIIQTCKENNTAIRIGTNHGSLSDRIISKYGNTEIGLVEATLEFLEICQQLDFKNVVVSIKSSNPTVMVHSNRLLMSQMQKRNLNFPVHLGVTEAGSQTEGRIKSALGIGALLVDGIGDTIRVSLTESPEKELPVASAIVKHIEEKAFYPNNPEIKKEFFTPFSFNKRKTYQIKNIGGSRVPVVICDIRNNNLSVNEFSPDYIITTKNNEGDFFMSEYSTLVCFSDWTKNCNSTPIFTAEDYLLFNEEIDFCFIEATYKNLTKDLIKKISRNKNVVFIAKPETQNQIAELRLFYSELETQKCEAPVVIKLSYDSNNKDLFDIKASIDSSVFLIDGLADGLLLINNNLPELSDIIDSSFEILQASHRRLSKTEFISCPSCGRTLFNLEEVAQSVKKATKHLKGLKIAIMGCIVNGPGEVADADYGYIGAGKNLVSLFKGKQAIKKNIEAELAIDELIKIIKENGDWVEP